MHSILFIIFFNLLAALDDHVFAEDARTVEIVQGSSIEVDENQPVTLECRATGVSVQHLAQWSKIEKDGEKYVETTACDSVARKPEKKRTALENPVLFSCVYKEKEKSDTNPQKLSIFKFTIKEATKENGGTYACHFSSVSVDETNKGEWQETTLRVKPSSPDISAKLRGRYTYSPAGDRLSDPPRVSALLDLTAEVFRTFVSLDLFCEVTGSGSIPTVSIKVGDQVSEISRINETIELDGEKDGLKYQRFTIMEKTKKPLELREPAPTGAQSDTRIGRKFRHELNGQAIKCEAKVGNSKPQTLAEAHIELPIAPTVVCPDTINQRRLARTVTLACNVTGFVSKAFWVPKSPHNAPIGPSIDNQYFTTRKIDMAGNIVEYRLQLKYAFTSEWEGLYKFKIEYNIGDSDETVTRSIELIQVVATSGVMPSFLTLSPITLVFLVVTATIHVEPLSILRFVKGSN